MLIDLHNHTPLCNHATGTPQSYAAAAFAQGCKVFGFSDHAPMDFDQKYRMSFAQMPLYEAQILELQEFYKGKMEVKLGYEVDFIEGLMDARVLDAKVDFLVGSVHFCEVGALTIQNSSAVFAQKRSTRFGRSISPRSKLAQNAVNSTSSDTSTFLKSSTTAQQKTSACSPPQPSRQSKPRIW